MSCPFTDALRTAEYISDPGDARWEELRHHLFDCEDCLEAFSQLTGIEAALRPELGDDVESPGHLSATPARGLRLRSEESDR